ncbi:ABC transporter permease [Streptomyces sp. ISL-11]|uniref:ABC transporter permease n=1 Tax=Streptomyces sp. ISL-11 TaxID=2819174 RepID=UPI001BE8860F|nr:ABC transporter permease [Streptomyces sp. ISL-11]MBT2384389.1 ABC transporter permease [Streptomyces sp. ISL-11]
MTAAVTAPAPASAPPARFRDLVVAEWIKIRSLRSTPWTLAVVALFVIGSAVMAALADYDNFPRYSLSLQQEHPFSLSDAFPSVGSMTLMLAAGCVGAITATSEYASGLIRTTTVAVPARGAVVLAKTVVVAALWTVVGTLIATGSFVVSQAILEGRDAGVTLSHPGALRALAASALLAPVCALIGLGLGVLIRHSATTMVTTAFTLLMLPECFSLDKPWSADIRHAMVNSAWQRLVQDWEPQPWATLVPHASIPASWLVYAVWPLVAIALAVVVVRRRDV